MTQESTHAASGQEVLVVDKDDKVARGLQALLGRWGLVVTNTADPVRARDLLTTKLFAVVLLDVDTPSAGGGLELLTFARASSPLTTVIVMTARKSFDIGVSGFRGGAADVVVKEPDTIPYLKDRVLKAAEELMAVSDRGTLLQEVANLHEEFLRRMREQSRHSVDLEDRLAGRETTQTGGPDDVCGVLLVDGDVGAAAALGQVLPAADGWRITVAHSGGEALDVATQIRPEVVLVKEPPADLPGRTVANMLKSAVPEAVVVLFEPASDARRRGGEVQLLDGARMITLVAGYKTLEQLLPPLSEIREGLRQKMKERRYLLAFRQANLDFLQRYNSVRQKMQAAIARSRK